MVMVCMSKMKDHFCSVLIEMCTTSTAVRISSCSCCLRKRLCSLAERGHLLTVLDRREGLDKYEDTF